MSISLIISRAECIWGAMPYHNSLFLHISRIASLQEELVENNDSVFLHPFLQTPYMHITHSKIAQSYV